MWIGLELFPFRAFVIGKEHEAILIEALQQNDPHRRPRVAIRRGKAHRVDVVNASLNRGGEPVGKLLDRVAIEVASAQTFADVLVTRSGWIMRNFHHANKVGVTSRCKEIIELQLATRLPRLGAA